MVTIVPGRAWSPMWKPMGMGGSPGLRSGGAGNLGDLEATFGGHELIDRQDAGFKVGLEMEAVGEERLLHGAGLVVAGVGGHLLVCGFEVVGELAFDVVGVLVEPVRAADDLGLVCGAVGVHDVAADAERVESSAGREHDHPVGGVGIDRLDGCDLVGERRAGGTEEEQFGLGLRGLR